MRTYDPNYPTYREYPKWIGNVLVADTVEETALRAAAELKAHTVPPEPEPGRTPSPSGIRMRRLRARRRDGKRAITVDVTAGQIEALIVTGVLDPVMQHDAVAVARAVGRLLDHTAPGSP